MRPCSSGRIWSRRVGRSLIRYWTYGKLLRLETFQIIPPAHGDRPRLISCLSLTGGHGRIRTTGPTCRSSLLSSRGIISHACDETGDTYIEDPRSAQQRGCRPCRRDRPGCDRKTRLVLCFACGRLDAAVSLLP